MVKNKCEVLVDGKPFATVVSGGREVFNVAQRSIEFFDHMRAHYREARRTPVEIATDIRLLLEDGTIWDRGQAIVRNVSPSGALIDTFKLEKDCFPTKAFKIHLVLRGGDYEGIGIEAIPVRFAHENGSGGLGVKFEEIFVNA